MLRHEVLEAIRCLETLVREKRITILDGYAVQADSSDAHDTTSGDRELCVILETKAHMADWLSKAIGPGAPFELTRGYRIRLASEKDVSLLAPGWRDRLIVEVLEDETQVSYLSQQDVEFFKTKKIHSTS